MKIKAVIWDVDGTLLNTQEGLTAAYRYTIEQCQLPSKTDEELRSYIGPTPQTIFTTHFGLNKEEAQHAADIFRERYKSHDLFKASLYPGVEDVLSSLDKAGIQQAIATNKRQDYATEICEHFGIDDYCDPIIGADNENKLTKADLIKKCLEELEISDPSSVVMIGDTEGDKQAAQAAGIQFLGVNYGFGFRNVHDHANSPDKILTILEEGLNWKDRLKKKFKKVIKGIICVIPWLVSEAFCLCCYLRWCLKERKFQRGTRKKKDWLYRDKFLNRTHRRIREIAETREEGITIGIVGSWGVGKTYMIEMLCDRLRKELRKEKQIPNGYNRAFKICEPVELWQAASLDDAWNRVIYALHTCILGKPPITQSKFWQVICNIACVNKVAKQICDIVKPEFEEFDQDAIEKCIGDSRVVLVFDDLERAKFEIVQAMLPLLERLKKISHLVVVCVLAEEEFCELMRRDKVSPEHTYGHLNKLFDLRFEIPEMGEDAVKNYLKFLFKTKHEGCGLTESFFKCHQIQFDSPRQMDRIVDKLTSIESQYFPNLHKELDFGNYSMTFNQTSTQILYIYVVEALRIIAPRALYELIGDYGTKEGEIPSQIFKNSGSTIISFCLKGESPSGHEQEWVKNHPQTCKELLKGRAFLSFLNIIYDLENHNYSDKNRQLIMRAFRGDYKRNTALSIIEAANIMKKNIKKSLALSDQIRNFYKGKNEEYESSFFEGNIRSLLQYVLIEKYEDGDEEEYLKYVENSLKKQHEFKVDNICSGSDFFDLVYDYMGVKNSKDCKCDCERFEKRGQVLMNLYTLMPLKDQTEVLLAFDLRFKDIYLRGINQKSNEKVLTYKNFIEKMCIIYGESLYYAIKEENIIPITEVPQYEFFLADREVDWNYIEKIEQGLANKLRGEKENKSFYISWLCFLKTSYMDRVKLGEKISSRVLKKIAIVNRFIRDKIRGTGDNFYSSFSPEEGDKALKQCNESIGTLENDSIDCEIYQVHSEDKATEYLEGIDELLSILREEKTEIEKVMASRKSPLSAASTGITAASV